MLEPVWGCGSSNQNQALFFRYNNCVLDSSFFWKKYGEWTYSLKAKHMNEMKLKIKWKLNFNLSSWGRVLLL